MTRRQLGQSDLLITPIGIGAWAMGGGNWQFGWGPQHDQDSIAAIHQGLARGVNWIDTAAVYGLGRSEAVVGRAIRDLGDRPYIFTKCSLIWDQDGKISHSLQASSIRREAEASLKRLGIDTIDLYQIHWPVARDVPEATPPGSIEEAMGAMMELQTTGKIRHIGVSNFDVEQMKRARAVALIASLQPPYSLLAREVERAAFPFVRQNHIGVLVYSPMASGLLSGAMTRERIAGLADDDWRKHGPNFQEPLLSRNLQLVEILRRIGKKRNATPGEIAIAWTLRNPAVTAAIVGIRTAQQVTGVAGAAEVHLNPDELAEIESTVEQKAA
jgi:aryl-alcohol dehydrogenase-like predicted oxidoreductase